MRYAFASLLAGVVIAAACGKSNTGHCTISADCPSSSYVCDSGMCVNINDDDPTVVGVGPGPGVGSVASSGAGSSATTGSGGATTGSSVGPTSSGVGGASTSSSSTGVGGAPTGMCLLPTKCVSSADCPMGSHCNEALAPPACQTLYCGQEGSACSETANCMVGFTCQNAKCLAKPACAATGVACQAGSDCCGGECQSSSCCVSCRDVFVNAPDSTAGYCSDTTNKLFTIFACACSNPGACVSACQQGCQNPVVSGFSSAACLACIENSCPNQVAMCKAEMP